MELANKITVKSIGAQPKPHSVTVAREIAHIYGSARKSEIGTTNFGEYNKFHGDFEAVNTGTGEVYRSGQLLLPKVIESLLVNALAANPDTPVEFAIAVGVKPADNKDRGGLGYEYTIKPLLAPKEADSLTHLREHVKNHARLPAPAIKK